MLDYILNKDTANELINVSCGWQVSVALNSYAVLLIALCCASFLVSVFKKKTIKDFSLIIPSLNTAWLLFLPTLHLNPFYGSYGGCTSSSSPTNLSFLLDTVVTDGLSLWSLSGIMLATFVFYSLQIKRNKKATIQTSIIPNGMILALHLIMIFVCVVFLESLPAGYH